MFGKNKKERKNKEKGSSAGPDLEMAKQIHIMPQRFYQGAKKKNYGLLIIIFLGITVLAMLAAAAVYFDKSLKGARQEAPEAAADADENVNINADINANVNENLNVNENVNINADINANVNENLNVNENVNINTNVNVNVSPDSGSDADNDDLTLAEENLYGTDPENSDTDGDGYPDGAELLAGYSPLDPAGRTLVDSGLFDSYFHPLYSIIYPKDWRSQERDEEKTEVLFISAEGEFVEVLAIPNPDRLPLDEWYQEQFSEAELTAPTAVNINELAGLRSPDNLNYYLMSLDDPSWVFLLTYNIGNAPAANFTVTFHALAKSFKLSE